MILIEIFTTKNYDYDNSAKDVMESPEHIYDAVK